MAKINGGSNTLRRTETALSGSLKDDSREELRDSYMSHLKQSKSRKSMVESKSDDLSCSQDKVSNSHQRNKEMSDSRSMNRYGTLVFPAHDDQISGLDLGNSFNKRFSTFTRKRHHSHEPHIGVNFARVTKKDLVPPSNKYHQIANLNNFLNSKFDSYAREYGTFFQRKIGVFEDKLDVLKREIQVNTIAEKRTQNSSHAVGKG